MFWFLLIRYLINIYIVYICIYQGEYVVALHSLISKWKRMLLFIGMSVYSMIILTTNFVLGTGYIMVSEAETMPYFSELIIQWKC